MMWFLACSGVDKVIEEAVVDADVYADELGDSVPWIPADLRASYARGQKVMTRAFFQQDGLGPFFNADSCASCHQAPVAGGSAPRYRDLWLVKKERWDGALESVGTNGTSPVRNFYATAPVFHIPEDPETSVYARRNTPPGLGVGLFAFIPDEAILANADPEDENADGISGRANFEQGQVGRFGYKAQAATLESFNRGAFLNQMGITTDPLFYTFPEAEARRHKHNFMDYLIRSARAQVSAPDEPTTDDDGVPDPEISDADQLDLLIFSTYLAAPRPKEFNDYEQSGERLFTDIGCSDCHIPRLQSSVGPIRAYTDLLVHDMGEDLADDIAVGFASRTEFRTQPLWGVVLHAPYLHDGRADTLQEAIEWHAGEAANSRDAWLALSADEQDQILMFLKALGGTDPNTNTLVPDVEQYPEPGEEGGPNAGLSNEELAQWSYGRQLFDSNFTEESGLSGKFNGDSCRACHRDPVVGGAGGVDVNILRFGHRSETGEYSDLDDNILPRVMTIGGRPQRLPEGVNVIEARNPLTTLGIGLLEEISEEAILANADPEDENADGISGRPRMVGERVGKYGWKANIATLSDFVADALISELGVTLHPSLSSFNGPDEDECPDPELVDDDFEALLFYLRHLSPPVSSLPEDVSTEGEVVFETVGCAQCHVAELDGVKLYSDLLLHDVAPNELQLVDQDEQALPTEFRTPPLWGLRNTAPYLHDGSASTVEEAIVWGHFAEALAAKEAYQNLSESDKDKLLTFLSEL